jgi:hypothetical protein
LQQSNLSWRPYVSFFAPIISMIEVLYCPGKILAL